LEPRSTCAEAAAKSAGSPKTVIARDIPGIGQRRIVARTSIVFDAADDEDDDERDAREFPEGDAAKRAKL
jgi:hypothetical protein